MNTAVIYARYSTGHEQKEESIEGQIRECTAFAKANDLQIVEIYADQKTVLMYRLFCFHKNKTGAVFELHPIC